MQSEIISLKHKLSQKEEALAEIVDEIVYFENRLKESESNSLELRQCLSSNNERHSEAIDSLIQYAKVLEQSCEPIQKVIDAKSRTSATLNSVAAGIRRSEQNLDSSLNIVKGWDRDGDFDGQLSYNHAGHNSTHVARSGSVFVQHTGSDSRGNPENNIVTTPRNQKNEDDLALASRKVRVKRSGSVLIEEIGESGSAIVPQSVDSPIGHGQISALRKRITELENELSEANVKLGRSERNRLAAIRDKDLMSRDLEIQQQQKEMLLQEKETVTQEVAAAQDDTMNAKRQQESIQRRLDSCEAQLREAWEAVS